MTAYQISTPTYEGPLDLLLQLVERRQLDITTVSLAMVTDQYVEYLRAGIGIDSEQLSEFVTVAARLLLIKSVALLPRASRPTPIDEIEDPTDLTERLREYEKVKRGALGLRQREESEMRSYPHAPPPDMRAWVERLRAEAASQPSLFPETREPQEPATLLEALLRIAARKRDDAVPVSREKWTVASAVAWLADRLRVGVKTRFRQMVQSFDRHRTIGAFLAILEMHRQGRVLASQDEGFGEIILEAVPAHDGAEPLMVTSET